jgi:CspA family cold shock protein
LAELALFCSASIDHETGKPASNPHKAGCFRSKTHRRLIYPAFFKLLSCAARTSRFLRGPAGLFSIDSAETTGMPKGTVKWFNPTKGYGFIQPATGGKDIFVHISAVQKAGLQTLNEGQSVEYEEIANRGKTSAENLKV